MRPPTIATSPARSPGYVGSKGLRVAFCIDNMNVGGTELNALRTARHLVEAGVELRVITLSEGGELRDRYAELDIPIDTLPIGKLFGSRAFTCGRRLMTIIERGSVQLVHAHDFYSNIFAAPWVRAAGSAFIASRRWWAGPDRLAQRWANRAAYLFAHRVLANSNAVADLLVRRERVRRGSIVVVPNFLDEEIFEEPAPGWTEGFAETLRLPRQRYVVGTVASLSPIKDHATLLEAVARLAPRRPELHVVLVGADAGSKASLEQLAARLQIAERVRFAGLRPNLPSPHRLFDVSVLTSLSEGMPNSVLEAMACGRPVVATAVGAVGDAVIEGQTGFLVPPRDSGQLAERLQWLLEDPVLAERLGQQGQLRARNEYSAPAAVARLLAMYRSLLDPDARDE